MFSIDFVNVFKKNIKSFHAEKLHVNKLMNLINVWCCFAYTSVEMFKMCKLLCRILLNIRFGVCAIASKMI